MLLVILIFISFYSKGIETERGILHFDSLPEFIHQLALSQVKACSLKLKPAPPAGDRGSHHLLPPRVTFIGSWSWKQIQNWSLDVLDWDTGIPTTTLIAYPGLV